MRGLLLLAVLVAAGCGSGSGGGEPATALPTNPDANPFGLSARPGLAPLTLPVQATAGLGNYELRRRFPELDLVAPIFLTAVPGEDRLVVLQQGGRMIAFSPANDGAAAEAVLDISAQILFAGEQGLLGLAFDPDFILNRYFYVHYSAASPRRSVISRFTWPSGEIADRSSEKVILEQAQPFSNHNGGMLAFGPDDHLYIALGDGGSGGDPLDNAQNPGNFLGSLLRIDVHPDDPTLAYAVPLDNPFLGQSGLRPETWAYGLRNPFRFSFDRANGALWLGDVGQGALEEINVIIRGGNFGWRLFEGTNSFDQSGRSVPAEQTNFPVHEYGRDEGVAVIGGYVYRGTGLTGLRGRYLYTDFGSGHVWALTLEDGAVASNDLLAIASSPTSFGEDAEGELYILSSGGTVHSLVETSGAGHDTPILLSQTGLFADLSTLTVAFGPIEYQVNQAFWSDGTTKRRWLAVPDDQQVSFSPTGPWDFPVGTVLVKHFELEVSPSTTRRLETRLLIHIGAGWRGFTYQWNEEGTDAALLTGRKVETILVQDVDGTSHSQTYTYPGPADCQRCHTQVAGSVLGVHTRQLNADFSYPAANDNQLRTLNHINLFTDDIGSSDQYDRFPGVADAGVPVPTRARTYLSVNCAQCHQPGGPTPVTLDLRVDTELADTGLLDTEPTAGNLGLPDARLVRPGNRNQSVLWLRMQTLSAARMPPVGSHVVDESGLTLIGQWIDEGANP